MASLEVHFTHAPGDWVYTPFGDVGRVEMAALNEDNIEKYYVKRNSESQWFSANELQRAADRPRLHPGPGPIPGPFPRDFPPYGIDAKQADERVPRQGYQPGGAEEAGQPPEEDAPPDGE
jgi:hypothetical protein